LNTSIIPRYSPTVLKEAAPSVVANRLNFAAGGIVMEMTFMLGLVTGSVVGIPLFSTRNIVVSFVIQVITALAPAALLRQVDGTDDTFTHCLRILCDNPTFAVGFAGGLILVGAVRAGLRNI
jgi:hypothetical protein